MIRKLLIIIGIFILIVLASAVIIPIVFKDKIIAKVKTEINNNVNAKVDFRDFDITILRSFPNLSFSLEGLSVTGINEFKGDTLTALKSMDITVDIMTVIKGEKIKIRKILLDSPVIYALVLKNGKANWDIAKPSEGADEKDGEGTEFKVALKKFEIRNGKVIYRDEQSNMSAELFNLNHTMSGDFTQDLFTLETRTSTDATSFTQGGVKYLNRVRTQMDIDMEADMPRSRFTFKNNEVKLNELVMGFDGYVAMPSKDITMDIRFDVRKSDFKNFLSLIPTVYSKDFADLKTSGKLAFNGTAKGVYNEKLLPAFTFNLQISDGMFKYPTLPAAVNNVQVDLKVNNPSGVKDHTVINLARFHVEMGKEPFDARLLVRTPITDPQVDAMVKGTVNLGNIQQMVPLEKGTTLAGMVTADLSAAGRMSQIQQQKYEDFKASGQLNANGIRYVSADMPQGVDISKLQLTFNPRNVTLGAFDMRMGQSDIHMNGTLENFIGYALKKGEVIKGSLNFSSSLLDINQLMGEQKKETTEAKKDTTPMSVLEVPAGIDFTLSSRIGTLKYDNMTMKNVMGTVVVRDQEIRMSGLSMDMLDGNMIVNGSYSAKNIRTPSVTFDLAIKDFDIQKTAATFVTVKKMAPIAERCAGRFSTKFNFSGVLDEKMQPVLNTLNGGGNLSTKQVVVSNFEPVNKVAEALKMDKYKRMDLNNINLSFKFKDGRVFVNPFDLKLANTTAKVFGSNGFDQSIDYTMSFEIPRSEFGGAANAVLNNLVSAVNSKGANFSVGDKINVDALIGGTVQKPTVKIAMKGSSGKSIAEDVAAKAKEEFDKKKAELEAKAREEADKARQEAETRVKAEAEKAKAEADRVKKEAEAKAKAEAEKAKKEAEQKAKDAAKEKLKGVWPK